ncbi:hypothetical protein KY284_001477 [Solanum tuberosum]|nr:hypothetical protein KY284_001477 [Solanum tuberosum]
MQLDAVDDPEVIRKQSFKDELEHEALLQMRGNNDEPTEHSIWTRRSRYDDSEHHNEASCSSSKKQRSGTTVYAPVNPETLQLFPTSPGFSLK